MRVFVVGWTLLAMLMMPSGSLAQTSIEFQPPAPGLVDAAGRTFFAWDGDRFPLRSLTAQVVEFEQDTQASAAISAWFEEMRDAASPGYDTSALTPVAIGTIADETQAMIGTAISRRDRTRTLEVAVVVIRDGNVLYTYDGWSEHEAPLDDVVGISRRVLGLDSLEASPDPEVPYTTGELFDRLPRIEHVPEGLSWSYDFSPCRGVFGASPCGESGTPAATPHPTPGETVTARPYDSADLIGILEAAGLECDYGRSPATAVSNQIDVPGQHLVVNGTSLWVFIFTGDDSFADREAAMSAIDPATMTLVSRVSGDDVTAGAPLNVYGSANVIAVLVDGDPELQATVGSVIEGLG